MRIPAWEGQTRVVLHHHHMRYDGTKQVRGTPAVRGPTGVPGPFLKPKAATRRARGALPADSRRTHASGRYRPAGRGLSAFTYAISRKGGHCMFHHAARSWATPRKTSHWSLCAGPAFMLGAPGRHRPCRYAGRATKRLPGRRTHHRHMSEHDTPKTPDRNLPRFVGVSHVSRDTISDHPFYMPTGRRHSTGDDGYAGGHGRSTNK